MTAHSHEQFAAFLLDPDRHPDAGIRAASSADARQRFSVHRNTFVVTLIDALAESFPVTQAIVGVDFFREMARARVFAEPLRTAILVEYAQTFPQFVCGYSPAASLPYLAEVAQVEAMRIRAFHAADAKPLATLAYRELAIDPPRLSASRVGLHPAANWLRCHHAAYSLWAAHQDAAGSHLGKLAGLDPDCAEDVLVVRQEFAVGVHRLPSGGLDFLDALRDGRTLGEAFALAGASRLAPDPAVLFSMLVEHGMVSELDPDATR